MNLTQNPFIKFLNLEIPLGSTIVITPRSILIILFVFFITWLVLKTFKKIIHRALSNEAKIKFKSIFSFFNYFIYTIVSLVTIDTLGIDLTGFFAASAALLVGFGLALQTFIQDIISGVFIIADQAVHVGDIIQIDGQIGKVENITLRTTRAVTRDNKVLIIPNHIFLTKILYNWTENGALIRESVSVGVAYDTDTELLQKHLIELALNHPLIHKENKPIVLFEDFGDNALKFTIVFSMSNSFNLYKVKSDLRFSMNKLFKEKGIEIPYPQRTISFINPIEK
jgi:small-conductance mechanosensitive channel|tara:strand:+ start:1579 stop:2424 length:846 start_codon:yes stop_codon:yes gene_type:complete